MPSNMLGAPNTRSHFPDALERGIRKFWLQNLPVYDDGHLEQIFNVTGSEKKTESDVVLAELGQAIAKAEGDAPTYDALQEAYKKQVTHTTFALAVEFTEESIEDNLYLSLVPMAGKALAKAMGYTRQVQAFSFFNDLTENIYTMSGTDYQLLETAHPLLNGSTWANRPTNATTLGQASLEERLQAWNIDQRDHRGLKVNTRPAVLMVGPSDEMLAKRLLQSPNRPQSADNDINPVRDRNLRLFVNHHLTDDGRWFLIGPKSDVALTFYDRVKAQMKRIDTGDTGNMRVRARMRLSKSCVHPLGIMGSPGS